MQNSNIRINSNVYPLQAKEIRFDRRLIGQIKSRSALRKLVECLHGPIAHDDMCRKILEKIVSPDILRLYWDEDVACVFAKGEKTYGIINIEGIPSLVCRCSNTSCKYFGTDECDAK